MVVVSFLQFLTPEASLSAEINRVVLEDSNEANMQQQLDAIAEKYGSIAALIHLHPSFSDRDKEHNMLKQVFFLAKHLKSSLIKASQQGDSCFVSVAHLDGKLGTNGEGYSPIAGGLFGLSKSLRWEWQSVFCRAIDLSPDLDTATSIRHIIAELYDPNRLIGEVAYSSTGRATLGL